MTNRKPRRTRRQWQSLIERYVAQTELTQQEFCEAEDLSLGTFRRWFYKLTSKDRGAQRSERPSPESASTPESPGFEAVAIRASPFSCADCCLELPGNLRLHTQTLPSAEYLQTLVKVFGCGH